MIGGSEIVKATNVASMFIFNVFRKRKKTQDNSRKQSINSFCKTFHIWNTNTREKLMSNEYAESTKRSKQTKFSDTKRRSYRTAPKLQKRTLSKAK